MSSNNEPRAQAKSSQRKRGMTLKTKRLLTALIFVAITCVGLAFHTGLGTPSMLGINQIAALCPLGGIEAAIASHIIVPVGVLGLLVVVVLILIFGRAFCAWGCPMGLLKRLFGIKTPQEKRAAKAKQGQTADGDQATTQAAGGNSIAKLVPSMAREDDAADPERGGVGDSRMWVLGGAVVTTAAFGFPVFCLVCPIGLSFATIICLWRAIQFGEATWSLIVFPAILIIEVVVLRRWCHTLCPVAALMSLVARGNKTFKASLDETTCLHSAHGEHCNKCVDVCPEGIDLHRDALSTPHYECIKCGSCSQVCPVHAITFPFLPKQETLGGKHEEEPVQH